MESTEKEWLSSSTCDSGHQFFAIECSYYNNYPNKVQHPVLWVSNRICLVQRVIFSWEKAEQGKRGINARPLCENNPKDRVSVVTAKSLPLLTCAEDVKNSVTRTGTWILFSSSDLCRGVKNYVFNAGSWFLFFWDVHRMWTILSLEPFWEKR